MTTAREELQDLLAEEMTEEEHKALKGLHLDRLPLDAGLFADLVRELPAETRRQYEGRINQLKKLNARSAFSEPENGKSDQKKNKTEEKQQYKEMNGAARYVPYVRLPDAAFEAIHVAGRPVFLCYNRSSNKFSMVPEVVVIHEDDRISEKLPAGRRLSI